MAYVWRGKAPIPQPVIGTPPLAEHARQGKRVYSFGDDAGARLAAKRETNRAYRERNRARVLARQRELYAKNSKKTIDTLL